MNKYLVLLLLTSCSISPSHTYEKIGGGNMHAGIAYLQSQQCSLLANKDACEWPDDCPGVDDEGAAYKEGQAAADDADCHEDQEEETEPEDPDDDNYTWFKKWGQKPPTNNRVVSMKHYGIQSSIGVRSMFNPVSISIIDSVSCSKGLSLFQPSFLLK